MTKGVSSIGMLARRTSGRALGGKVVHLRLFSRMKDMKKGRVKAAKPSLLLVYDWRSLLKKGMLYDEGTEEDRKVFQSLAREAKEEFSSS